MKNTTNYGLMKPEVTDFYNIEHQNENMDIIDGTLHNQANSILDVKSAHNTLATDVSNIDVKVNEAMNASETAVNISKGKNESKAHATYSDMVNALNTLEKGVLNVGQNIYIGAVGVPDVWIYSIEETSVPYTYTSDADIVNTMSTSVCVQIGYYKIAQLETQKVDLTETNEAITRLNEAVPEGIQFRVQNGKLQFRYDEGVWS